MNHDVEKLLRGARSGAPGRFLENADALLEGVVEFEPAGGDCTHSVHDDLAVLMTQVKDHQLVTIHVDGVAGLQVCRCLNHVS